MTWNKKQQQILDSLESGLDKDILVAAAAGSGKTAVLVERIIRSIVSGKTSIDEILVVTFTNAAAAQMKEKIIKALEKKATETGSSELMRQLAIAESADIMTLDSFCNKVASEYFSVAGIDPGFSILDGEELVLLTEDVMDRVLVTYYEDGRFTDLIHYVNGKVIRDSEFKRLIKNLLSKAGSFAEPDRWLRESADVLSDVMKDDLYTAYLESTKQLIKDAADEMDALCMRYGAMRSETSDDALVKALTKICTALEKASSKCRLMASKNSLDEIREIHEDKATKWPAFPKGDIEKLLGQADKEAIYSASDMIKKIAKTLPTESELVEEYKLLQGFAELIVDVCLAVSESLLTEKKKRRRFDFSDIEHFAYNILADEESHAAEAFMDRYKYIYIDEYQDSNDLQENLIQRIARRDDKGRTDNVFMVGDVKQCIYKFRQARPELFTDKQGRFAEYPNTSGETAAEKFADADGLLMNLNMNYRSRVDVLEATNFVFGRVMTGYLGGIVYDDAARLNKPDDADYYEHYPQTPADSEAYDYKPEYIIIEDSEDDKHDDISTEVLEATAIARRIKELVGSLMVLNEEYDKDKPESEDNPIYRPARYSDVVILQRKLKGITPMLRTYEKAGVPAVVLESSGYFDAVEIHTLLAVLSVIDNIYQDVPYASVLMSDICGLTENDMTIIKILTPKYVKTFAGRCMLFTNMYGGEADEKIDGVVTNQGSKTAASDKETAEKLIDEVSSEAEDTAEDELREARAAVPDEKVREIADKLKRINDLIRHWKDISPYISIAELIERVLMDTRYDVFASAMFDGDRRIGNIRMLIMRAANYESKGRRSLFEFLRYIEKCKLNDQDFGEAGVSEADAVHIISMHKSKGLEYPIVILPCMEKEFNMMDTEGSVVVDSDYHISMDYLLDRGGVLVKHTGKRKQMMTSMMKQSVRAEEARLLYVAMTRAKEKLIIIGKKKKVPKSGMLRGLSALVNADSMSDYLSVAMEDSDFEKYFRVTYMNTAELCTLYDSYSSIGSNYMTRLGEARDLIAVDTAVTDISATDISAVVTAAKTDVNPYDYIYPYFNATRCKSKRSVSEIKAAKYSEEESRMARYRDIKKRDEVRLGVDVGEKLDISGGSAAIHGTITHYVMEQLDYDRISSREDMAAEIRRIIGESTFTDEELDGYDYNLVTGFYSDKPDSLFVRMKSAAADGRLYREQQFMVGLTEDEIPGGEKLSSVEGGEALNGVGAADRTEAGTYDKTGSVENGVSDAASDRVIVQGIIDAYFYEDGDIVLVDYKTDKVKAPQELLDRYMTQLYLYKETLEKLTGHTVKETMIYSYRLGEIICPV